MAENLADLEHAATEKIGPLPAWGWGLIVGGVGLVAYFLWGRSAVSTSTATTTASDGGTTADPTTDGIPNDTSSISDGTTTDSSSTSSTTSSFTDSNAAWLARAMAQVSLEFGASPADVYTALYTALQGGTITATQNKYWSRALSDLGTPPEGTEGTVTVTADAVASNPTSNSDTSGDSPSSSSGSSSSGNTSAGTPTTTPAPVNSAPTPAKPAPTPAPSTSITSIAIGSTYTLEKPHRGYSTAAEANSASQSKYAKMLDPGKYVVVGRQKLSSGYVVRLLKGVTALWINV